MFNVPTQKSLERVHRSVKLILLSVDKSIFLISELDSSLKKGIILFLMMSALSFFLNNVKAIFTVLSLKIISQKLSQHPFIILPWSIAILC